MQLYQNTSNSLENQEIIAETAVVLELLAFTMGAIANPRTPAALSQALAILGYNCAINWAAMLNEDATAPNPDTDRLDLRTSLGKYTGQQVIDMEMRIAKGFGFKPYNVGVVVGTINAVRGFGAIDEQAYMAAFKALEAVKGGAQ